VAQATSESRARAVSILLSALSIYDELHMVEAAGRVLTSLNTLAPDTRSRLYVSPTNRPYTHRVNTPHAQASPANLTRSETKVVQLVARGKSNRQIAQELGISEKTVANHLSHIFSKTTSENRAAAAAFAIRHGFA
jgi:DNA-binding NarL/FixJ family response regulator